MEIDHYNLDAVKTALPIGTKIRFLDLYGTVINYTQRMDGCPWLLIVQVDNGNAVVNYEVLICEVSQIYA